MAKDDFSPIVYRILATLYNNLKEELETKKYLFDHEYYGIKESFFNYIINYLIDEKFIANVKKVDMIQAKSLLD